MDRIILTLSLVLGSWWFATPVARAVETVPASVSIRFEQTAGLIRMGDIVPVVVRIDTHGQSINAAELDLTFSTVGLEVDHISQEQSIFTVWAEQPTWNNRTGTIHATAGRPNGIIASDASIMTVYFRAPGSGAWEVSSAATTRFLLNDGRGTKMTADPVKATIDVVDSLVSAFVLTSLSNPTSESWTKSATIDVSWTMLPKAQYSFVFTTRADLDPDQTPEVTDGHEVFSATEDGIYYFAITSVTEGIWSPIHRRRFLVDHTPPKEFSIIRLPGSQLDGRDALTWLANDATSGVATVTVLVNGQTIHNPKLPLRIQPLWAGQEVAIVLTDQAGNERRATYRIPGTAFISWWVSAGLAVLAMVAGLTAWFIHRRHHHS